MKRVLKGLVSEQTRRRIRRFGRVRWVTKTAVLKRYGASPRVWWRYLLTDPEVDSFTYRIANRSALAEHLARVLPHDAATIERCLAETDSDLTLRRALRQPLKHVLWSKRAPEPRGYHQACWAVTRLTRPATVVETGILDGMASTVILAALARNRADGHPGRLVSFDIMPGSGQLVPSWLRGDWQPVYEDAVVALDRVVGDAKVGFFTSDSLPDPEQIRAEFDAVLRHRDAGLVAMTTWGDLELDWPVAELVTFREQPVDHFFGGVNFAFAQA